MVEIEFDPHHVDEVITDFGTIVDCIENSKFSPAPLEKLKSRQGKRNVMFATTVCRNCDARFSCNSYRAYAQEGHGRDESVLRQYMDDFGTELDQQDWLSASLETGLSAELLD